MPLMSVGDWLCHYRIDGGEDQPVLILAHSLGLDFGQWDAQVADFLPHFKIVRYDLRGHGLSGSPAGEYTVEQLGHDALGVADALQIQRFAFCGLSLGGMVAQWLASHAPDRLTRLVIANTTPRPADPSIMETRRRTALETGMTGLVETVMARFFSSRILAATPPRIENARRTFLSTNPIGYAGCCAAIRDMDMTASLRQISLPALVIVGDHDIVSPWEGNGEVLANELPDAQVVRLASTHISNIETPRAFSAAVLEFLVETPSERWAAGLDIRRAVLGVEHVDKALASTTDFTRDFQELITTYAWGTIWTRPGFDHRTRRLLVLAMMVSLGRWEEFRMHLRAGIAHDLEWCDVKEVLLQSAIYAGVPAANTAFHIAAEVQAAASAT